MILLFVLVLVYAISIVNSLIFHQPRSLTILRAANSPPISPPILNPSRIPDLSQRSFPTPPEDRPYDMIIFGCGPGGEYAAVRASQLGARVALVEIKLQAGGPTGLTSKAVREAAKQISRAVSEYGNKNYKMNVRREIRRLWSRNFKQKRSEAEVMQAAETRARLALNGVDVYIGTGVIQCENDENSDFSDGDDDDDDDDDDEATKGNFFSSAFRNVRNKFATTTSSLVTAPQQNPKTTFTVRVCRAASDCIELTTKRILLATGSRPYQPTYMTNDNARFEIPWTEGKVIHAAKFSSVEQLPNSVAVIGGGVIAVEYATVLSRLKVGVTLIADRKKFMPLLSKETRAQLRRRMKEVRVRPQRERP